MPITRRQARAEARKENGVFENDLRTKALGDDSDVNREETPMAQQINTSQNSFLKPVQSTNR